MRAIGEQLGVTGGRAKQLVYCALRDERERTSVMPGDDTARPHREA